MEWRTLKYLKGGKQKIKRFKNLKSRTKHIAKTRKISLKEAYNISKHFRTFV